MQEPALLWFLHGYTKSHLAICESAGFTRNQAARTRQLHQSHAKLDQVFRVLEGIRVIV